MNRFFCIFRYLLLLLAISQSAFSSQNVEEGWDVESDKLIASCLSSETFENITLQYFYENQLYDLRILHNPQGGALQLVNASAITLKFKYGIIAKDAIPEALTAHLEEIVLEIYGSVGGYWSQASCFNGINNYDLLEGATGKAVTQELNPIVPTPYNALDEDIFDLFTKETLTKLTLDYPWKGKLYRVHLIFNPQRKPLICRQLETPVRWPFAMAIDAQSYPLALAEHLKRMIPGEILSDADSMIDVATQITYQEKHHPSMYGNLHSIQILTNIENPIEDAEIKKFFLTEHFAKKIIYYELNGIFYKTLLICNPEKLDLKASLDFRTWSGVINNEYTFNTKFGVFFSNEAPQKLVDHITQLYSLPWWDFWNETIQSGDVSVIRDHYAYAPYTWFTLMLNAEPQPKK